MQKRVGMCVGSDCPIRQDCARFIAFINSTQSKNPYVRTEAGFFVNATYDKEKKSCPLFKEINTKGG